MLQKNKTQKGFTIIEVLIVLAIAGLILLIVFLAVPALQRNSRNTQRKNDVANYMSAVNEWTNNNGGKVPSAAADLTTADSGVNALAKLGFYSAPTGAVVTGAQTTAVDVNTIVLVTGAKCSTTNTGQTIAGATRSVAIRYAVESSSGAAVPQCQD